MVVLKGIQLRSFENKNFVDTRFLSIPVRTRMLSERSRETDQVINKKYISAPVPPCFIYYFNSFRS